MKTAYKSSWYYRTAILCIAFVLPMVAHSQSISEYASFPGGVDAFFQFVNTELEYPPTALQDSVEGIVYVDFMINEEGDVVTESVVVSQGINTALNDEAIRIIRQSPRWIPAKDSGAQPIQQLMTFPVTFRLPVQND
jgi:periplasmic protein TonB